MIPAPLAAIVSALDAAGIPHMLTGSFASAHHGAPRATQDVDLVVDPSAGALRRLAALLPEDAWYFDVESALDALARSSQFNVLHHESGWKFDLIVKKRRPFSEAEFDRRLRTELSGLAVHVATAEDVIVAKLEWAKKGSSRRRLEDVAGILRAGGSSLDDAWIDRWVAALGLGEEWAQARELAG